eukprot:278534_1
MMEILAEEKRSETEDTEDTNDDSKVSLYDYECMTKYPTIKHPIYTDKEFTKIQQFIEFANDSTKYEWRCIPSNIDDFTMEYVASSSTTKGICIARGTVIIDCNPEMLFFGYDDYTKIKELDENCLSVELKHKYDDNRRIICSTFNAPSPAWNREFLFKEMRSIVDNEGHIIHQTEDDKPQVMDVSNGFAKMEGRSSVCLGFSIESEECPFEDVVQKQHVRCDLQFGGYYFQNIGDNKCKATYLVCMDLKGWIPTWFSNIILPQQSKNILTMKRYIESLMKKMQ